MADDTSTIHQILENNDKREIEYIYHLSDIHVRPRKIRHQEYIKIFDSTFKKMVSLIGNNTKKTMIVLTGDIMHTKTEQCPDAIHVVRDFLTNLTNIAPVILIAGNHDCNMSNKTRLDALSPIVGDDTCYSGENIYNVPIIIKKSKNTLYYLKKTGFYQYHNIIFGVTDIFSKFLLKSDMVDKTFLKNVKQKNKYLIALYHGTIDKSQIDSGHKMHQENLNAGDFDGYNYVMLGDIHKFQYMNKKKTIAYAGSLIQQSHGESITNHGFLQWFLADGKSKYHQIINDYGFCTIDIIDGKMIDTEIPPKPSIRFRLENTTNDRYNTILTKIMQKYQVQNVVKNSAMKTDYVQEYTKNITYDSNNGKNIKMGHTDHIKYYLKLTGKDRYTDAIIDLHKKIYKQVIDNNTNDICDIKKSFTNQSWKLMDLHFSNVLSYGENNIIDFDRYLPNHVIGIVAPNHYGKSAIIDVILFCLFGKCSRNILNNSKNNFCCKLRFKIGSKIYIIERTGYVSRAGDKMKAHFNKLVKAGRITSHVKFNMVDSKTPDKIINLTESKKINTDKKILELIGTYDDYVATSICLQQSTENFIDMGQTDRRKHLVKMFNIDIFESCHKIIDVECKTLSGSIKTLTDQKESVQINNINNKINEISIEMNRLQKNIQYQNNLKQLLFPMDKPVLKKYHELDEYQLDSEQDIINEISAVKKNLIEYNTIDFHFTSNKIADLQKKCDKINHELSKLKDKKENLQKQLFYVPDNYQNSNTKIIEKKIIEKQIKKNLDILCNYNHLSDDDILSQINDLKNQQICDNNIIITKLNNEFISYLTKIITSLELCLDDQLSNKHFMILTEVINKSNNWIREHDNNKCKNNPINTTLEEMQNILKMRNDNKLFYEKLESINEFISQYVKFEEQSNKNKKITDKLNEVEQHINDKIIVQKKIFEKIATNENKMTEFENIFDCKKRSLQKLKLLQIYKLSYMEYQCNLKKFYGFERSKKIIEKLVDDYSKKYQKLEFELQLLKNNVESYNKCCLDLSKNENLLEIYKKYRDVTDLKKGLPSYMIKKCTESLSDDVNNILGSFVDFKIQFVVEHIEEEFNDNDSKISNIKNKYSAQTIKTPPKTHKNSMVKQIRESKIGNIHVNMCRPHQKPYDASSCSGFEKFIIGLAIRVALTQITLPTKPNFIAIDEGWSCFDNNNLGNVDIIINFIKQYYDHVIIISHLEEMKQQCDYMITIDKIEPDFIFSYVNNQSSIVKTIPTTRKHNKSIEI